MLQQPPCLGMMLLHPRIQPRRIHQQAEDFAQPCFVIVEADELGKAFLRFKVREAQAALEQLIDRRHPVHRHLVGPHSCTVQSPDRKSTRLNSSHQIISYAVFCLKKKKKSEIYNYVLYKKKKHARRDAYIQSE